MVFLILLLKGFPVITKMVIYYKEIIFDMEKFGRQWPSVRFLYMNTKTKIVTVQTLFLQHFVEFLAILLSPQTHFKLKTLVPKTLVLPMSSLLKWSKTHYIAQSEYVELLVFC